MCCAVHDEAGELRTLLRSLRGPRSQRDVAGAAAVSLSLYKRLESGRLTSIRLRTLIRVAHTLGAEGSALVRFMQLTRPDVARMVIEVTAGARHAHEALSSIYRQTSALLHATEDHDALRIAVELLHVAVPGPHLSFALERDATGQLAYAAFIPADASGALAREPPIPARFAAVGLHAITHATVRVLFAPIRSRGRIVAVLGLGHEAENERDRTCELFLENLADIFAARPR